MYEVECPDIDFQRKIWKVFREKHHIKTRNKVAIEHQYQKVANRIYTNPYEESQP